MPEIADDVATAGSWKCTAEDEGIVADEPAISSMLSDDDSSRSDELKCQHHRIVIMWTDCGFW